jgi:hypothetical protein
MDLCGANRDGFALPAAKLSVFWECQPREIARESGLNVGFVRATA